MISLLKKYKRLLAWLISGLVITILLSWGIPDQKPATAFKPTKTTATSKPSISPTSSDFAATHQEPNFYQ